MVIINLFTHLFIAWSVMKHSIQKLLGIGLYEQIRCLIDEGSSQ